MDGIAINKHNLLITESRPSRFSILDIQVSAKLFEPRREKTGLRGFRPGPTQTGLYKLRKELEA